MSSLLTSQHRGGSTPVQREAVENPLEPVIDTLPGKEPENPLEPGNEAMEWKNRGEVPQTTRRLPRPQAHGGRAPVIDVPAPREELDDYSPVVVPSDVCECG